MNQKLKPCRPPPDLCPLCIAPDVDEEAAQIAASDGFESQAFQNSFQILRAEDAVTTEQVRCQASEDSALNALEIRDDQHQSPAGPQHTKMLDNYGPRVIEMFDQARGVRHIERIGPKRRIEEIFTDHATADTLEREIGAEQQAAAR